jgi:hypothetical protein
MQRKVNKSNSKFSKNFREFEREERQLAPPQIQATPIQTRVVRYVVGTTMSQTGFTVNNLNRGPGGCVITAVNTAYPQQNSVKLRKVEAWAPPQAQGSQTTLALQWETGGANEDFAGPANIVADSSIDPSRPAHIVAKPPKLSQSGFWKSCSSANTNNLFTLTAVSGTIVDFHISYTQNDSVGANSNFVVVGGNVGGFYHQTILGGLATVLSLNTIV